MKYSATVRGFYADDIEYASIPEDAVEVSKELYDELFAGQAAGKEIVPDENGYPTLK